LFGSFAFICIKLDSNDAGDKQGILANIRHQYPNQLQLAARAKPKIESLVRVGFPSS
jgi:hypothetical protein